MGPARTGPAPAESFAIGEVASMVGLSAHTIRAWERRYAAVLPARSGARQRRYSMEDVETLKRVKDLASARGLSLRLAVMAALGEIPDSAGARVDDLTVGVEVEDGGPWRAVADLDSRLQLIIDARGRVIDANVAAAKAAGVLRFELPGRAFTELVDPYDRAKAVAVYRGTPEPHLGWELNLRTSALTGLFSFDCLPFPYRAGWLIACTGREVG